MSSFARVHPHRPLFVPSTAVTSSGDARGAAPQRGGAWDDPRIRSRSRVAFVSRTLSGGYPGTSAVKRTGGGYKPKSPRPIPICTPATGGASGNCVSVPADP